MPVFRILDYTLFLVLCSPPKNCSEIMIPFYFPGGLSELKGVQGFTHRPQSSSFLGFPYRILNMNPQKGTTLGPMVASCVSGSCWRAFRFLEGLGRFFGCWFMGVLDVGFRFFIGTGGGVGGLNAHNKDLIRPI